MVDKITEDQAAEYRDAFTLFDKRGDNKIDSNQIGDVMRALGLNPTEAEVKKIRQEVDPSGSKRVSFEEFLPIFLSCQAKKEEGSMEDFIEGLKVFDKEGNGFINSAELRHVLTSLAMLLSPLQKCWPRFVEWLTPKLQNDHFGLLIDLIQYTTGLETAHYHDVMYTIQEFLRTGEKLSDEEVDALLVGVEDSQGQVNYEEFIKTVLAG